MTQTPEPDWFKEFSHWADDCPGNRSVGNLNGLIAEVKHHACTGLSPEVIQMMLEALNEWKKWADDGVDCAAWANQLTELALFKAKETA